MSRKSAPLQLTAIDDKVLWRKQPGTQVKFIWKNAFFIPSQQQTHTKGLKRDVVRRAPGVGGFHDLGGHFIDCGV